MILRGTFLARQQDLEWFLGKNGVRLIYPEMSDLLVNSIPTLLRTQNLLADIITTLNSDDEQAVRSVTKAWQLWGGQVALGSLFQPPEMIITEQDVMQAKTELHYAQHHYFLADNQLLANCHILQHIPTMIIHGRNDLVCPLEAGWQLHKHLPHSQFILLPNSGHIAQGEEMIDALVSATEAMKNIR
jgi:proline iminopeptidase